MTAAELEKLIGKTVAVPVTGLNFLATITAAKREYGNVRVLLVPVAGTGEAWKNFTAVVLEEGQ